MLKAISRRSRLCLDGCRAAFLALSRLLYVFLRQHGFARVRLSLALLKALQTETILSTVCRTPKKIVRYELLAQKWLLRGVEQEAQNQSGLGNNLVTILTA